MEDTTRISKENGQKSLLEKSSIFLEFRQPLKNLYCIPCVALCLFKALRQLETLE